MPAGTSALSTRSSIATRAIRLRPRPRRFFPPAGGFASLALSMPEGLIEGGPFSPFSRAISARCSATTSFSAETSPSNASTSAFSSAGERSSRLLGGDMPPQNPNFAVTGIAHLQGESICRAPQRARPFAPVTFLSAADLSEFKFELDIAKWELNRTHWAVKDVNLPKELHVKGITLPAWTRNVAKAVDITTHLFDVGLSFPGEARELVDRVAYELERLIGPNSYFYD